MRPILKSAMLSALFCFGAALPAHADFKVCNQTKAAMKVAFGRFNGTEWMSEGWWSINPRRCRVLLSGKLQARYYYLYASNGGAGSWDGNKGFCVSTATTFQAAGRANCAARGFDRKGFFEVDTGAKTDFTQSLSD